MSDYNASVNNDEAKRAFRWTALPWKEFLVAAVFGGVALLQALGVEDSVFWQNLSFVGLVRGVLTIALGFGVIYLLHLSGARRRIEQSRSDMRHRADALREKLRNRYPDIDTSTK